jgi:hypothetical protein
MKGGRERDRESQRETGRGRAGGREKEKQKWRHHLDCHAEATRRVQIDRLAVGCV